MQIIRQATLDAAFYAFDLRFRTAMKRRENWWSKVATEVMSGGAEMRYPWITGLSGLREWVGERVVDALSTRIQIIPNKDFEKTVKIPRNAYLDDQIGLYGGQVDELGYQAMKWPDDLMASAIQAGSAVATYDGQGFFDTDHPQNLDNPSSAVQSNLLINTPLTADNYNIARTTMRSWLTDGGGRPMGVKPTILMVPPQLEKTAKDIIAGNVLASLVKNVAGSENVAAVAIDNTLKGTAEVVVVDELGNKPDDWFLLDTSRGVKPFIFQNRQAPNLVSLTQQNDRNVFFHKEYIYGVDTRGNVGYGPWFLALKATANGS